MAERPSSPGGLAPLPPGYVEARLVLQRVATHVLARRRHDLVGKLGLRATPGGIGTPAAGPEHEVVRTVGHRLVRERTGTTGATTGLDLARASLADAAALVEVDLAGEFDAGGDAPPVGEVGAPLRLDADGAAAVAAWFAFAWPALDAVLAEAGPAASPTVVQLWPEHFDAGADLGTATGRANVGASAGDGPDGEPYLYVGPWGPERPGDPAYWNAPFGAVRTHAELLAAADPAAEARAFLRAGLGHLGGPAAG